jgi:copper resistance protein B
VIRCSRPASLWLAGVAALAAIFGTSHAQTAPSDVSAAAPFGSPIEDQSVLLHAELDQLEERLDGGNNGLRWDGEAWVGTDENRLWLKSEGYVTAGQTRDGQDEVLYDRPLTTYFDLQTGVRYDLDSYSGRGWGAIGLEGLAPFNIKISATAYASDAGHYALKLSGTYELLLTQRLVLEPQWELNGYTRSDAAMQVRAGWSQFDTGLRLRYEIRRKFAPYVGAAYSRDTTTAAKYADQWRFVAGVRLWF